MKTKIDYVTVIFKNYDLLDIQREILKTFVGQENYNLIIVDNTPPNEKKIIYAGSNETLILRDSINEFDGISHGMALDLGLRHVTSDIVCLIDSDFFILNKNIHEYVLDKFNQGYFAVGAEWNDGAATIPVVNAFPEKFYNIPCCFCGYYDYKLASSNSWVITPNEIDRTTSFIEVGWRIRKYILDNNIKSFHWTTNSTINKNCIFMDENDNIMGVHYVAGSHRRINDNSKENILNELKGYV